MRNYENIHMNIAEGFSSDTSVITRGHNYWLLEDYYDGRDTNTALVSDLEGFQIVDELIAAQANAKSTQPSSVIYTSETLMFPSYAKNRTYFGLVLKPENLQPAPKPVIDFRVQTVDQLSGYERADYLFDSQYLISTTFGFSINTARTVVNERTLVNPNQRVYVGVAPSGETLSTLLVKYDGSFLSLWNVATKVNARGHGLAQAMLYQALTESHERHGQVPAYLLTAYENPKVYTRLGFEKTQEFHTWWKRYPQT